MPCQPDSTQRRTFRTYAAGGAVAITVNMLALYAIASLTDADAGEPLRPGERKGRLTLRFTQQPPQPEPPERNPETPAGAREATDPDTRSWLGSDLPDIVQGIRSVVDQAALDPNPGSPARPAPIFRGEPDDPDRDDTPRAALVPLDQQADPDQQSQDQQRQPSTADSEPEDPTLPVSPEPTDGELLIDPIAIVSPDVIVPIDTPTVIVPPAHDIPVTTEGEGDITIPPPFDGREWKLIVPLSPPISTRAEAPEPQDPQTPAQQPHAQQPQPGPPAQGARGAPAPGDPAEQSEQQSPAASIEEATEYRPGQVLVRKGLKVNPRVAPELRDIALLGAAPTRDLVLLIAWDAGGLPREVRIMQSSGNPRIDTAWDRAAYGWRAEGEALESLTPGDPRSVLWQSFRISAGSLR